MANRVYAYAQGKEFMVNLQVASLLPMVPSGEDFGLSRRFFRELGFKELRTYDGFVLLANGGAQFILQDLNDEIFAQRLMISIMVLDLDGWWGMLSSKGLDKQFPGILMQPPKEYRWGREASIIDIAGVCWRVAEVAHEEFPLQEEMLRRSQRSWQW